MEANPMTLAPAPAAPALLLTITETAQALRLSRAQVYNLVNRGELQTIKIGSSRRVPLSALEEYIQRLLHEQHHHNDGDV
jgi:excisionase family DNA binding protein